MSPERKKTVNGEGLKRFIDGAAKRNVERKDENTRQHLAAMAAQQPKGKKHK